MEHLLCTRLALGPVHLRSLWTLSTYLLGEIVISSLPKEERGSEILSDLPEIVQQMEEPRFEPKAKISPLESRVFLYLSILISKLPS